MEKWRNVIGYEDFYEVSNLGKIRNKKTNYILIGDINHVGYRSVGMSNYPITRKRISYTVHRCVASAFIPNSKKKPQVNHKNGIKLDNRVENLEWVTAKENTDHAIKIGLHEKSIKLRRIRFSGEGSPAAKLNWKKVGHIRNLYKTGEFTQKELGWIFSIHEETIRGIINNQHWKEERNPQNVGKI